MNFAEAMRNEEKWTKTENGAVALKTTGEACLDLFSTIGSLRNASETRIQTLFEEAYKENPLKAMKILFYSRDIREGAGERRVFRTLIRYISIYHPEALRKNIRFFGEYGRYDDLYSLVETPLEEDMWGVMKDQLNRDISDMKTGLPVSLLAKWIKTPDASSKNTRKLGIKTALKLGYTVKDFKRVLRKLRKYIDVTEAKMSANEWDEIEYSNVPSRAMMIYRNAFQRHDQDRFSEFSQKTVTGEVKINSSTLYPYDIVEKYLYSRLSDEEKLVLEAQWRQLPNYVEERTNAIVIADVSDSMRGRPMATSIGLALYFAEHNQGDYHNLFMTFSASPYIVNVKGETLEQKLRFIHSSKWGMDTNLEAAFDEILSLAIENKTLPEEMPKSIIVISDMEIDYWGYRDWTFYDQMRAKYIQAGYEIPNVVFWNVNSRNDVFHADAKRKGLQLVSGQSATIFKYLIKAIGKTPIEMMNDVIEGERYRAITI